MRKCKKVKFMLYNNRQPVCIDVTSGHEPDC